MDAQKAAGNTLKAIPGTLPVIARSEEGTGTSHALWMLKGIEDGYIQHDKAHRWLGYAQGLLVSEAYLTLEACKNANKEAS